MAKTNLTLEHLELLHEAGLEFSSTLDSDELLARIFDRALEVLDAEAGSIWLRKGDVLVCEIARGPVGEKIEGLELPMGAGLVGDVALRGESELVADATDDPRFVHQVDEATGFVTRSVATTPLKTKDDVLGALQVLNKRSGTGLFNEADLTLLEGLAATASLALHNSQLHGAEKRARDLKSMLDISREITSTLDTDRLAISLVNMGSRILNYDRAMVSLAERGQLTPRAISGQETFDAKTEAIVELDRLTEWLLERGEVAYIVDIEGDTELASSVRSAFPGHLERTGIRSLCLVPLQDDEGLVGAFYMESAAVGFLGNAGLEAAQLLATQASVALRNSELYGQVPLIGVLAPVAEWWRRVTSLRGTAFLRRVVIPAAIVIALLLIPWRERISIRNAALIPGDRMPVRATVDGLLTDIRVDEGATVSQGDVLALLREDEFTIRIAETEGELASSRREAAAARAAADETRARMAEIRATELAENLVVLERQLARTRIRAPVDGTILTVRPYEMLGEYLDAGQTFVLMGRTDRLQLEGQVRQFDIERVQNGYPVRLKVAARPNHTFIGTVTQISPAARSAEPGGDVTVTMWADLDNGEGLLRPGLEARAKVVGARRPIGYIVARPLIRWLNMTFWR